jgi:hypothetical protein
MRVVPLDRPWKGHQPLYIFDFLTSHLNIWKDFKILSRFIQKWIQPPACTDHGLYRNLSSYWLAHFYLMKNPPKWCTILVWIAGCWNSLNIVLTSRNPKNNCWLLHFWSMVWRKRSKFVPIQTVIQTSRMLDSFLYESAQNFEVSNIQNKN